MTEHSHHMKVEREDTTYRVWKCEHCPHKIYIAKWGATQAQIQAARELNVRKPL